MVDMEAIANRFRTPVTSPTLALVLALYILHGDFAGTAYKVLAETPLNAQFGSVGVSPFAAPLALIGSLAFAVLYEPVVVVLAYLIGVAFPPFTSAGTVLNLMTQVILVLTCQHLLSVSEVGLLSIQIGARLTPSMKVIRCLIAQMEEFRRGGVLVAALRAAFHWGCHTHLASVIRRVALKWTGDAKSLFGSEPSPLHLNYTTVAACVSAAGE